MGVLLTTVHSSATYNKQYWYFARTTRYHLYYMALHVCVCLYATILYATWEKGNQEPAGLVLSLVCLSFLGRPHGWIPRFYRDHYITNPNNALLQGKSLKTTIHLHCLIPPKCVIY